MRPVEQEHEFARQGLDPSLQVHVLAILDYQQQGRIMLAHDMMPAAAFDCLLEALFSKGDQISRHGLDLQLQVQVLAVLEHLQQRHVMLSQDVMSAGACRRLY